ncbi:hypothetical protein [Rheinheimera sp. 1928-s]|uniref:hypothetical protein n=1 Tax=Rheinheimera sp. 1928-s TaxID=3033803 RepID=UPI0026354E3D|nr:hypothetical protein [Rheinheimera sp. 1928-s]MDF3124198.1 hypothetical protein [Rheinheimera sp. 1928-s]
MKLLKFIREKAFNVLAYVFFNRKHSLIFCITFSFLSLATELFAKIPALFSCSGAVITIAGLFLNIKYSLNFHLKIPKINLYNKLSGAGVFGTKFMTPEQEHWVDNIISDEVFGVSFMVVGTIIWAYGSFFIELL